MVIPFSVECFQALGPMIEAPFVQVRRGEMLADRALSAHW